MSFESIDELDHVLFVYRQRGRWGSIARSRDPGLHGRKPVFATPRALALSYVDPYVDFTGRITGYTVVDLRDIGNYDWRLSEGNVWKVERMLLELPHRPTAHVRRAHRSAAQALSRVPRALRPQAGLLPADGSVDGAAAGVHEARVSGVLNEERSKQCNAIQLVTLRARPHALVQIEVSRRLRDRLVVGLPQRLLEALRQRVAARPLGRDRLLEEILAPLAPVRRAADARRSAPACRPARGSSCRTMRRRLVSMTSVAWQHGQVVSNSDLSFIAVPSRRCLPASAGAPPRPRLLRSRQIELHRPRRWSRSRSLPP